MSGVADHPLGDRVVIVTGAAIGLGRGYARHLARAGALVAVADIDAARARDTAKEIGEEAGTGRAVAFEVDVSDRAQVDAMVDGVADAFGRVDVLVNNAGGALFESRPFDEITDEHFGRIVEVNLTGTWQCARSVCRYLRPAGYGKIINVSSTMVGRGQPAGLAPYIAAKAGVVGLTRAMATELGPHGIRVNAIAPGYTPVPRDSPVRSEAASAALRQRMVDEQCIKRLETPEDLCGTVEYLASPASDFVTGQVINVDGGWVLH